MIFSLNDAAAEPSRSGIACQAYLTFDTIEYVNRGEGDFANGWAIARNQDELYGSINFLQLMYGLLINNLFLRNKNRLLILLNQKPHLRQDCLPSIAGQDGTSFW